MPPRAPELPASVRIRVSAGSVGPSLRFAECWSLRSLGAPEFCQTVARPTIGAIASLGWVAGQQVG